MFDQDIEKRLNDEITKITPNVLSKVMNTVDNIESANMFVKYKKNNTNRVKKLTLTFSIFIICFVLILTGVNVYGKEYETITIDTNPSIELVVNRLNKVINVNYNNNEAYNILREVNLKNKSLDRALEISIDQLIEKGFLDDEENIIIISGYNKVKEVKNTKLEKIQKKVEERINLRGKNVTIISNVVSLEDRDIAKDMDISYGKLKLIKDIISLDSSYTINNIKDLTMKDLKDIYKNLRKVQK